MKNEKLEDSIKLLFVTLLNTTPAMIRDKHLYYNIGGEVVNITWFTKRDQDAESPLSTLYYEPPFKDCSSRSNSSLMGCLEWATVCSSPELEGYTFYINTPAGQLRVPELNRRELIDVQEIIEKHYEEFIPMYIDRLLSVPTEQYRLLDQ